MTPIDLLSRYDEIWLHDFEFVAQPGEHPDVVCLAWHELRIRADASPVARRARRTAAVSHRRGALFV